MNFSEKQINFPTSCKPENWNKNRYPDILCNEETKFEYSKQNLLNTSITDLNCNIFLENPFSESVMHYFDQENCGEQLNYINANYIKGTHSYNTLFIATQAPLENTMEDFYQMIWESNSKIIISLASLVENQKIKMHQFWPGNNKMVNFGQFSVTLKEEIAFQKDMIVRKLSVFNLNLEISREIFQIHFTGWPDCGVPHEINSLASIYYLQKKFLGEADLDFLKGPIIVHW